MNKAIYTIGVLLLLNSSINAQQLSPAVQAVYDACISLRTAIGSGNTTALKAANKALKDCHVRPFTSLICLDEEPISLDGHFVFDDEFIDSLIAGRDVYRFAQRYAEVRNVRTVSSSNKIFIKTCAVKASSKSRYTFHANGTQELAVVAEPGRKGQNKEGKITLRVHDKTNDIWHNDTMNVKTGKESRYMVFDLPDSPKCIIELEIINCGDKDISFVVISN